MGNTPLPIEGMPLEQVTFHPRVRCPMCRNKGGWGWMGKSNTYVFLCATDFCMRYTVMEVDPHPGSVLVMGAQHVIRYSGNVTYP